MKHSIARKPMQGIAVHIFCESGSDYGLGHFYRCVRLARICANISSVKHVTLHNRGNFTPSLASLFPTSAICVASSASTRITLKHYDWLHTPYPHLQRMLRHACSIIDSYMASASLYQCIARASKLLLCLDDTLRDVYPKSCYIINPSSSARKHFIALQHRMRYLLCGEEFSIMEQQKAHIHACHLTMASNKSTHSYTYITPSHSTKLAPLTQCLTSTPSIQSTSLAQSTLPITSTTSSIENTSHTFNIFVHFGGVDSHNLTQTLLHHLSTLQARTLCKLHFHIVLGGGYTHTLHIPHALCSHTSTYHHLPPHTFLALASSCDIGISAGGGSMLELLWLQIPSIIIEAAPNQRAQIRHFATKGTIIHASINTACAMLLTALALHPSHSMITHNAMPPSLAHIKQRLQTLRIGTSLPHVLKAIITSMAMP